MAQTRSPHETVFRNVLLFPAAEDKPRVVLKEFSEEGANHRHGFYTTALNLRSSFGKYLNDTRLMHLDVTNNRDASFNGEYACYFNLNVKLLLNRSLALALGVDPKRPGRKAFWRGDVYIVKQQEWPGPLVMGGGAHKDWVDVPSSTELVGFMTTWMQQEYEDTRWENLIEDEKACLKSLERFNTAVDPLSKRIRMMEKTQGPKRVYPQKDETEKTIAAMEHYRDKQISRENCKSCGVPGNPDLKVCSRCKQAAYCSKDCQKMDWKNHKAECARST